jgi:hypothetical protein
MKVRAEPEWIPADTCWTVQGVQGMVHFIAIEDLIRHHSKVFVVYWHEKASRPEQTS